MLTIWLARHGEAESPDQSSSDFNRNLTEAGRQQLSQLTTWLISREEPPELFLHSPLVRARQTAEVIAHVSGADPGAIRAENRLAPGIITDDLLQTLSGTTAERILCVGHQPDVSRCLAETVGGGHYLYSPGTVARVDFTGPIIRGGGYLRWLCDPDWFE